MQDLTTTQESEIVIVNKPLYKPLYNKLESASIYARAVFFNIMLQLVAIIVLDYIYDITGTELDLNSDMRANLLLMLGIQITLFVAVYSKGKKKFANITKRIIVDKRLIIATVVLAIIILVGFMSTNMYFSLLLDKTGYTSEGLVLDGLPAVVIGFVVICLIAPILEEVVFRFGLLEGLRESGIVKAVLFSAASFTLMHMNPEQTFYQFAIGLVAAILVYKTGNLLLGIVLHMSNNIITFLLGLSLFVNDGLSYYFAQWYSVPISIALAAGAVLATIRITKYITTVSDSIRATKLASTVETVDNDEIIYNNRIKASMFGKATSVVLMVLPIVFCVVMWIMALLSGFGIISAAEH